ncbi:histidine phosphatase superfamily [Ephemerocybe angulata]|uniref:Histidine phosphatase superfamily n=1 Tax=Ephemerocybe angulata TaxID=980116 RepID=A0A8H6HI15_9AGAR|nr:histidine phosphatase superfamily [Tulosesus angulatus]
MSSGRTTSDTSSDPSLAHPYRSPQVPLEVENYPVAPDPLQLEQVHVFVRHGERTPVGVRLAGPPANIPEHWNMCNSARRFRSAVSAVTRDGEVADKQRYEDIVQGRKVVERKDGRAFEGECLLGELTDLGRYTTHHFGKNLRRLYVERLGFLPDQLDNPDTVYFRTTNMPRTTESLQEIVRGLYPAPKCRDPSSIPPIRIRNGKDENLVGNTYSCKRLEFLLVNFAKSAADAYNPTLAHLDKKLSKYIDGNPVRLDGRPRASGILDTVRSSIAHGIKVPSDFEDKSVIDTIERAVVTEWFSDKTEEVRRLGMGRLFDDMLSKMQRKVEQSEKDPLRILVHSTHDTAIAAIHQTLDVFDDRPVLFERLCVGAYACGCAHGTEFQQNLIGPFSHTLFHRGPGEQRDIRPPAHRSRKSYLLQAVSYVTTATREKTHNEHSMGQMASARTASITGMGSRTVHQGIYTPFFVEWCCDLSKRGPDV